MNNKEILQILKKDNLFLDTNMNENKEFNDVTYNSKLVLIDTLFICKGYNFKEEYLEEAKSKGATCYISEKKYEIDMDYILVNDIRKAMALLGKLFYKLDKEIKLLGVTGTKGKTTSVYFIHNILDAYFKRKTAYLSTIDYYTGKEMDKSHNTTPESLDLYKYIKEAEESNFKYLVMEVSSQAEKLHRIYGLNFEIGAITNIGKDHISPREHPDYEDYLNCKIGFLKKCKKVYIYKEIDEYERIRKELEDKEVITFGFTDCDYKITNIRKDNQETLFTVNDEEYRLKIRGKFNCINACLAIAVCKGLDIPYEDIYKGLYITEVVGRMTVFEQGICPVIVDYAHNKLSIETLLTSVKEEFPNHKIKLVVGCPGDKAFNRRKEVADLAGLYCNYIYVTAEDPGSKKASDICNEVVSYLKPYNISYEIIEDREQAIIKAINDATKDDIILIIGKGDETYQLVGTTYEYYKSDVVLAEELTSKVTN